MEGGESASLSDTDALLKVLEASDSGSSSPEIFLARLQRLNCEGIDLRMPRELCGS